MFQGNIHHFSAKQSCLQRSGLLSQTRAHRGTVTFCGRTWKRLQTWNYNIRSPTKPSHLAAVSEICLIWVDMQHVWTPAWSMHDLAFTHITHSGWNRNSCRGTDAHMNVDFRLHIDCLIFGEVPSHVIRKKSVFDIWPKPKQPASSVWTLKSTQQGEWKIYWFAATMKARVKRHSW